MQFKDYYKILEVDSNATADQIKKSYRRLAMTYHPDRNPGNKAAEDMFKEINEAYDVLSNPEKRKKFDLMRDGKNNSTDFYTKNSGSSYSNKYSGGRSSSTSKASSKAQKDADDFDRRANIPTSSTIFSATAPFSRATISPAPSQYRSKRRTPAPRASSTSSTRSCASRYCRASPTTSFSKYPSRAIPASLAARRATSTSG